MTLADLKTAIKVDYTDDDTYISLLMEAAKDYIDDAVTDGYDADEPRHELMLIALVDDAYKKRSYTVEKNDRTRYIMRSIVAQLNDGW